MAAQQISFHLENQWKESFWKRVFVAHNAQLRLITGRTHQEQEVDQHNEVFDKRTATV